MLSFEFYNIRRTQFDQSFPVHPVSDFRGGTVSVTEEKEKPKSLSNMSNMSDMSNKGL